MLISKLGEPLSLTTKYLIGYYCQVVLCMVVKNVSGRPRPHFLSVNKIEFDANDWTLYTLDFNEKSDSQGVHPLSTELAKGVDLSQAQESARSLFSGHASCGSFAGTFFLCLAYELFGFNWLSTLVIVSMNVLIDI